MKLTVAFGARSLSANRYADSRRAKTYIRVHTTIVRFDWDDRKSDHNLEDRGFDSESSL
jgi:hypothetical protein